MTYDWIYNGLFILHIATMTRSPGRIDRTQARISNYFDGGSPGYRYAVWITIRHIQVEKQRLFCDNFATG